MGFGKFKSVAVDGIIMPKYSFARVSQLSRQVQERDKMVHAWDATQMLDQERKL
jgi:hypothetical protein